jgi:hypothetical protein
VWRAWWSLLTTVVKTTQYVATAEPVLERKAQLADQAVFINHHASYLL